MGKLKNFISKLHNSTKRDYVSRMVDNKVYCMKISKKYDKEYWDGKRRFGYGGYKYIPDRWKGVAKNLISTYGLKSGSKVLDVGCGKGFLLHEMLKIEPNLKITGFDISQYAIDNSKKEIKHLLTVGKAENNFPYSNNNFDLVISLGTLHNLTLKQISNALKEITRVGEQGYIMVESYRNNKELFNLQCWALTAETIMDTESWKWILKKSGYLGDYEFIYFN